ncbi:hypothetical protein Sfum_0307 [Syntrophobacter fumaroxidans MPOB]|uniref:Uncharacterized protein n=1 Tax=Syntrophobacter fumaroxidans (strain DSM 10017 / MPOB) TaxID=335543 RepID=A0LF06_SYNFM|nr:hypothetical protein Sfum_0307 [Syntrophobacter fumaroxidans MPOB]
MAFLVSLSCPVAENLSDNQGNTEAQGDLYRKNEQIKRELACRKILDDAVRFLHDLTGLCRVHLAPPTDSVRDPCSASYISSQPICKLIILSDRKTSRPESDQQV